MAHAALHAAFERQVHLVIAEPEFLQVTNHKPVHHWRTTDQGIGVLRRNLDAFKEGGDNAYVARPTLGVVSIYGTRILDIVSVLPKVQVVLVQELLWTSAPVQNLEFAVLGAVLQHFENRWSNRDKSDAPCHKEDILALQLLHGPPSPKGTTHPDQIAGR
jgi:hypothetical protein